MTCNFRVLAVDNDIGLIREAATPFTYPGGEHHLKNLTDYSETSIWIADVRGADVNDLTYAHLFANVAHQRRQPFVLMLPYLPAARSDRGEPNGAVVYAEKVKAMNPQQVIAIDPHSRFVMDYYERSMPEKLYALDGFDLIVQALRAAGDLDNYNAIISPDKGAAVRAEFVAKHLGFDCYHADKHRDFDTGKILGVKMTEKLPESGRYLVVDDICDGGGTFMGLAEATGLHRDRLGLWITHGIFSGEALKLRQYYQSILTTDSHPGHNTMGVRFSATKHDTERVHIADVQVPCEPYMLQCVMQNSEKFI
jgi:phosphoribosylpyrophosphate synthetase